MLIQKKIGNLSDFETGQRTVDYIFLEWHETRKRILRKKTQAGKDAQAFFGENIAIDNQLVVKAADPVAAIAPPPAAKLYFDTGKTDLANDAEQTLAPIVEWLKANASAKAIISGYHDPRGNLAVNEELAKNRAKAVRDALKAAGIDEARIELRKPVSTEGDGDLAEARRVEVSVE